MRITKAQLLDQPIGEAVSPKKLEYVTESLKALADSEATYLVFAWDTAPKYARAIFNWNGGDEDWMVITRSEPEFLPSWLERMDAGDGPDVYILDGVVAYVASHA